MILKKLSISSALRSDIVYPLLVLVISFFTICADFSNPQKIFWDENYHIASAQKYLHGIFFQENHPPLGKLLIALGEFILEPNLTSDQFLDVSKVKDVPSDFKFDGYRLFPTIFAWLTALVIYGILREMTGKPFWAFAFSSLYFFDNAMIVHLRGAMLEGIQLFFLFGFLYLVLCFQKRTGWRALLLAGAAGLAFGFALNTKINSLALAPFGLLMLWHVRRSVGQLLSVSGVAIAGFLLATFLTWAPTIALSGEVNPKLENNGMFKTSPELQAVLKSGATLSPRTFYLFIKDHFVFSGKYNQGVPQLNLCKPAENGSYPALWPIGSRTISYRWNKTPEGTEYLYLVPNPAVWLISLLAVITTGALLLCRGLNVIKEPLPQGKLLAGLFGIYLLYLSTVLVVGRVLYLYHYFIPLIVTFFLIPILFSMLSSIAVPNWDTSSWSFKRRTLEITPQGKDILISVLIVLIALTYNFYSPLTYARPITNSDFQKRNLLALWDMTCAGCDKDNPIARPIKPDESERRTQADWKLTLGGVRSRRIIQSWGDPRTDRDPMGAPLVVAGEPFQKGFGVHAYSQIDFPLEKKFSTFRSFVGIPSSKQNSLDASVVFEVWGDGKKLWNSPKVTATTQAISMSVSVSGVSMLQLRVTDAGDGRTDDHAAWLEPRLE